MLRTTADSRVRLLHKLGWQLTPKVARLPGLGYAAQLSAEHPDVLDADVLLVRHTSLSTKEQFDTNPAFARLSAVRSGAYITLSQAPFIAVRMPGPLNLPFGLRHLVSALERALPV